MPFRHTADGVGFFLTFLARFTDPLMVDVTRWAPLYQASYNGDAAAVASLLNSGVDHLAPDTNGKTALHWAVLRQRYDVVQVLLEYHANWKEKGETTTIPESALDVGQAGKCPAPAATPLELAAESNNRDIFNLLLDNLELDGALPRLNTLWEPTTISSPLPHTDLLADSDIRPLNQTDLSKVATQSLVNNQDQELIRQTLLQISIRDDKFSVFRFLLQQGTNPNHHLTNQRSPLHAAVMCRRSPHYIRELLQHGADPSDRNGKGLTALHLAILEGDEAAVAELLEGGASPNVDTTEYADIAPLMLALYRWRDRRDPGLLLQLIRQLLAKGADVNVRDPDERTPLHTAARAATLDIIQELVSSNADVTALDKYGASVFRCLSVQSDIAIRKQVWDHLVDSLPPDHTIDFNSALHLMVNPPSTSSFLSFIDVGFSFYRPPGFGTDNFRNYSPLETALVNLSVQAIQYILETFEDPDDYHRVPFATLLLSGFEVGCGDGDEPQRKRLDSFFFLLSRLAELGVIHDATRALHCVLAGEIPSISSSCTLIRAFLDCGADMYQHIGDSVHDSIAYAAIHDKGAFLLTLLHDRPPPESPSHWLDPFDTVRQSVPDDITAVFICMAKAGILNAPHGDLNEPPISIATKRGDVESVRKMISSGADLEAKDEHGWRPLHLAILPHREALFDVLLEAHADVNAPTETWSEKFMYKAACGADSPAKWTGRPLHIAAMFGLLQFARKLIARGADVNARSTPGRTSACRGPTALHIALGPDGVQKGEALSHGRLSVAEVLVHHGADLSGVIAYLAPEDSPKFEAFPGLWDALMGGDRAGTVDVSADSQCSCDTFTCGWSDSASDNGAW